MKAKCYFLAILVAFGLSCSSGGENEEPPVVNNPTPQTPAELAGLSLPEGFALSYFAENITNARSLTRSDDGKVIFVGSRQTHFTILVDDDLNGVAETTYRIDGLNSPNGVAFHNGDLYVAEISRILKYGNILSNLSSPGTPEVIYDQFPTDRHHGWKFIAIGPDEKLYVPVGAPCNICLESNEVYSSITRMNLDGSGFEIYAHGVRNTVGFDWHPENNELWFTENGADGLGDESPNCELNVAGEAGLHFGFPYWHSPRVADVTFGNRFPYTDFEPAVFGFEPHSAPLGARFYQGDGFPPSYKNSLIVAQHGSWNRSQAAGHTGYEVKRIVLNGNQVAESTALISGWLNEATNEYWGRPVDVLEMPDGSLLISDDFKNCVYRLTYSN